MAEIRENVKNIFIKADFYKLDWMWTAKHDAGIGALSGSRSGSGRLDMSFIYIDISTRGFASSSVSIVALQLKSRSCETL